MQLLLSSCLVSTRMLVLGLRMGKSMKPKVPVQRTTKVCSVPSAMKTSIAIQAMSALAVLNFGLIY